MSSIGKTNGDDRREVLERRAALVRAQLEQRLDVLDKRRDNLVHRVQSLTKPPVPMLALLAVGVLGTVWIVRRSRSSSRKSSETRYLTEPRQRPQRGWFARALQKAAVVLGAAALRRVGAWSLDHWLGPDIPARRLPAPPRPSAPRLG